MTLERPTGSQVLAELLEGNRRFRQHESRNHLYSQSELRNLAEKQTPIAGIIACSDSRITPEVIFDQPLGTIFSSRVPGNVAADSSKWMLDLAVGEFKVPLVMVMGHSGCLAVGSLLDGDKGGAGGMHRFAVLNAVYQAKAKRPDDLYTASIEENAVISMRELIRDSIPLRHAVLAGETQVVVAVYEMETGEVRLLDAKLD